jgi:hypothetical protein
MKNTIALVLAASFGVLGATRLTAAECAGLSADEKKAGYVLLFDGSSMKGWHGYNGQKTPAWKIADCSLETAGTEGNYGSDQRADISTDQQFTNFELSLEWKASKGGNSGVMYGVVEDPKYKTAWMTGPEYQFIDDVGFPEKLEEWQKAAANYAMHVPNAQKQLKPVGEWNSTKIVVNGKHVEHWLNGKKVASYDVGSADWNAAIKASKFDPEKFPSFGKAPKGYLGIQGDHPGTLALRNIRIRELQ